ncbi:MAG: protein kinase, partial [Muribaculaceae bacterium]|nr:protein kinase [Muribaculaceae bacterium]
MVAASQALQKGAVLKTKNYEYVIEKVLGSGTYGITYLATAHVALADGKITQMRFAIKEHFMNTCYRDTDGRTVHVTEKGRAEVERTRTDFLGESERLQSLCMLSRNIVNVIESFRANGTAYYVMEYLDGGNPQPTTESEAVHIVRQVAEALGKIHQSYMLHLDIKPANIVFKSTKSGDRYPVLIDFGVAKRFDHLGNPKTGLQAKGASRGYAPQEQFSDIKSFSPKYDIYALGGVLLYLLSGKNPPDAAKVSPAQTEIKEMIP